MPRRARPGPEGPVPPGPGASPFAPAQPTVRRRDALRDVHVERETIVLHGDRVPRTRGPPLSPTAAPDAAAGAPRPPCRAARCPGAPRARTGARGRGRGGPHSAPPPLTWDFARHFAR